MFIIYLLWKCATPVFRAAFSPFWTKSHWCLKKRILLVFCCTKHIKQNNSLVHANIPCKGKKAKRKVVNNLATSSADVAHFQQMFTNLLLGSQNQNVDSNSGITFNKIWITSPSEIQCLIFLFHKLRAQRHVGHLEGWVQGSGKHIVLKFVRILSS